jgi:murein hydrolase activator
MIGKAALIWLILCLPVAAETDATTAARAAAEGLRVAIAELDAAKNGQAQVDVLTRTIKAYEEGLGALRDGLRRATIREQALKRQFDAKREQVAALLGAMTAMQRTTGPLLLLHPSGPLGTARSGMMLTDVTPAIQAEADLLRHDLEEVALLRQLQQSAADTVADGLRTVQDARTALSQAIADRTNLPRRLAESPEELNQLIQSVETLDGFADLLSDTAIAPENTVADFAAAQGTLALPVQGSLLRGYGEADAAGIERPGILIATRAAAIVTTPWPATIRYLGPLLDYGNVMILEPSDGTLMVLAGLGTVYGKVGEVIPQGSPVGLMGGAEPQGAEFVASAQQGGGEDRTETLYIELRQGAKPIDPTDWFAETRK